MEIIIGMIIAALVFCWIIILEFKYDKHDRL